MQGSNNPSSSRITVILTVILGSEMALYGPWIVSWREEHRIMREQSVFCSSSDHCEWAMVKKGLFLKSIYHLSEEVTLCLWRENPSFFRKWMNSFHNLHRRNSFSYLCCLAED